jgi:short-subunit dehydrogenase
MPIEGRRFVLTGATGGIGGAIARALDAAGAQLLLTGRHADALERLRRELHGSGHRCVAADLAAPSGRTALVAAARDFRIDGLINNAGGGQMSLLDQTFDATIEQLVAINLTTPMLLCKALLPLLRQRDDAVIVNVGSILGSIGYAGSTAYCASKFGLRGFTEALRRELADTPVRVVYFAPRATDTPLNSTATQTMNQELGNAVDTPEAVAQQLLAALRQPSRAQVFLGFPEAFFVRLNALLPKLVDKALRKQLPVIRRHAQHALDDTPQTPTITTNTTITTRTTTTPTP